MEFLNSPNKAPRTKQVEFIVVHGTWMAGDAAALERLCDEQTEVSCHYYIKRDGEVIQLVMDADIAWHAGVSQWGEVVGLNASSLGIEIANDGVEAYTEPQYSAVISLIKNLSIKHHILPCNVLAHSDIATGRKDDPGAHFNWQKLYDAKVAEMIAPKDMSVKVLKAVGYRGLDADIMKAHLLRF
jgi:N-acetylmuramoyl-L-alanine amidase